MTILQGYSRVIGAATRTGEPLPTSYFGDGSDGVIAVNSDVSLPVTEDTGHIFKQYKTLTIGQNGILRPAARCAGMVIACRGDCVVDGLISMNKMAPRLSATTEALIRTQGASHHILQLTGDLTGGNGGNGGFNVTANKGIGGNGFWAGGGYGGGGAGYYRTSNDRYYKGGDSEPRPSVTMTWPYLGTTGVGAYGAGAGSGSGANSKGGDAPGGGGGKYDNYYSEHTIGLAGDAYGGGALWLIVGGNLVITGSITANGGNGGGGYYGGGGGGGGIIVLLYMGSLTMSGNLFANGGQSAGSIPGAAGGIGTVYVHKINENAEVVV